MDVSAVLSDALGRAAEQVRSVVEGLEAEGLAWQPDPDANSIGWLVWHLTRVEDDHIAAVAGGEQLWTTGGWAERFRLPYALTDTGYGHDSEQVGLLGRAAVSADLLAGYHAAVAAASREYVESLRAGDLDRVVDEDWDPPVTLGVRLVSVVAEVNQHVGQAAYVKGLLERR